MNGVIDNALQLVALTLLLLTYSFIIEPFITLLVWVSVLVITLSITKNNYESIPGTGWLGGNDYHLAYAYFADCAHWVAATIHRQ